jgi:hypothetical protein
VSWDIMTVGVVSIATVIGIGSVVSIDTETEEVKEVEIFKSPLLKKGGGLLFCALGRAHPLSDSAQDGAYIKGATST